MIDISGMGLQKIKETIKQVDVSQYPKYIDQLKNMEKKSYKDYGQTLLKKYYSYEKEIKRLGKMCSYQEKIKKDFGAKNILCIDEVGRGPLAGPVTVCGVMLDDEHPILGVKDSKKLSEKKRKEMVGEIHSKNIDYHLEWVDNHKIDQMNILNATLYAMRQVVKKFEKVDYILVDGNMLIPSVDIPQRCIVKGDDQIYGIALASIIAKVARDDYMTRQGEIYPHYDFKSNKGYGTKRHVEAIKVNGPCELHRKTFIKKFL